MKLIDWPNRTEKEKRWYRETAWYFLGILMGWCGNIIFNWMVNH